MDIHSLPQERLEGRLLSLALSGTEGGREAYLSVVKPEMFTGPRRNWHQAVVAGAVDLVWAQKWLLQNRKGLDGLDTIVGELGSTRPEQDAQLLMEAWAKREGQRILTEAQEWISVDPSVGLGRLASEAQKTIELASPVSLSGWSDAVASALDEAEKAARGEFEPRLSMGLGCMDDALQGGVAAGWQVIIGARPKVGKTALGLQAALVCAQMGHPVVMASYEMYPKELAKRAIAFVAGVSIRDIRRKDSGSIERYRKGAKQLEALPLMVVGTEHNTPELLEAAVLKTKRELGAPKMLVVDYLQLMTTSGKPESREREVAEVSRKLKKLALRYGLANIILAQLNRDSAKGDGKPGSKQTPRAPAPHDLRDSGAIEQDADVIFLLNIPHVYGQPDKQKREIIVGANRHGEADQTFTVRYEGSRTRYVDT